MMPILDALRTSLTQSRHVQDHLLAAVGKDFESAGALCLTALQDGHKLLFFGNGGSAADAQHLAAELVGRFSRRRRALPALALTVNTSTLTAVANDFGFQEVFARQVEALGQPGDVAIALSTSGDSPNILAGLQAARRQGLICIGLTGEGGGQLKTLVDVLLAVPSRHVPRVQEAHILLGHALCAALETALFGGASTAETGPAPAP